MVYITLSKMMNQNNFIFNIRNILTLENYELYSENKIKYSTKIILIITQGIERVFFLISAMTGAVVLVNLIRVTFVFNLKSISQIFIYLFFEFVATLTYKFRQEYYRKSNLIWYEIDQKKISDSDEWDKTNFIMKNFTIRLQDYYVYTNYFIIIFVFLLILFINRTFSLALTSWILLNLSFFISLIYIKRLLVKNKKRFNNYSKNSYFFKGLYFFVYKSKIITIKKLSLFITPFCISTLFICLFFLVDLDQIGISQTLITLLGIRQILASIRSIELASLNE